MITENRTPDTKKPERPAAIKIILHLLLMIVSAIVIGWIAMLLLDVWTNHGKTDIVPNVKGLTYENAVAELRAVGMEPELSDSVYDDNAKPGVVMEQNPRVGSKVKPGRTVYLSINAFYPRIVSVPKLTDISLRQARSILEALGIKNIKEKRVLSEHMDLILGAEYKGKMLLPQQRIPVKGTVTLLVGDGMYEMPDTIDADEEIGRDTDILL